ncbi:AbgT family transporter [Paenibacillus sp. N1-5-1-14]|uniref:AbgT family transporter n=1 Tax=Paenibacillus radicibacter TaxID=2972488 RepID=UPI002158CC03|nr:AbgT family transporter [Paenibacillus radicibacter]MCR8642089.1 AbgT family transporter [Paenibacillus radicibacter]
MSTKNQPTTRKKGLVLRSLDMVERIGNKLPDPIMLFFFLSVAIIVLSAIFAGMGISVEHPVKPGETLAIKNLLSTEGIQYLFESAIKNFTGFAPLGTVLVCMLGIGVAERSGLIAAALKALVTSVPKQLMTASLVFGGVMSSMAADAGYVVLTSLGAILFLGLGRHPIAGLSAAFAGVSGGFSANLLLTSLDPLLGDLTKAAAATFDPVYAENITVAMNYYFMCASVFLITIVGTFVTDKIVEPRLGVYNGEIKREEVTAITSLEKKGLWLSLVAFIVTCFGLSLLVVPSWGPLHSPNGFSNSLFIKNLVPSILIVFLIPGLVYGYVTKTVRNGRDVAKQMSDTIASMGGYIVLAFMAGQFIAYFNETNMGMVLAIKGAEILTQTGLTGIPLILVFIVICGIINIFIGSASAKWALLAPVFVPIMMQIGYTPEFTQLIYRIADSTTNIISPLMAYFAVVIAYAQKYDKKIGIGTLVSTMLPYSVAFTIAWVLMLILWMFLGIDLGPGAKVYMP